MRAKDIGLALQGLQGTAQGQIKGVFALNNTPVLKISVKYSHF